MRKKDGQPRRRNRRKSEVDDGRRRWRGERRRRERWGKKGERSSFAGITRYFPGGRVTDCVNWLRFPQQRQKGTTRLYATSRRLHWLVVAAFTDNTESTVYRGALWNYEDGTEDGLEKKKKTSSTTTTTTTTTKMDRVQHRRIKRGSDVRLSFRSSLRFLFPRIFAWIGRGGGAKTRRGIQDKGFLEIPTLLSTR